MGSVNMVEWIRKVRDGEGMSAQEIQRMVEGALSGEIPDYQLSAWAMAVYFAGLSRQGTVDLTKAMAESGDMLNLSSLGRVVDKHSTGGVGDKTTLVVAPWVAAAGVFVAKMSGRGLGHTGGTIDKLESIRGFRVEIPGEQFRRQIQEIGVAVVAQTMRLVPFDKLMYALRDVTATVESIPLIASSIMAKKIAGGAQGILLDVKVGRGAFMTDLERARELSQMMVEIGEDLGRQTVALLTSMDQPLGKAVGNALEVREAIEVLQGGGPEDLRQISLALGQEMLLLAGICKDPDQAREILLEKLNNGSAWERFVQLTTAQGADPRVLHDPDLLPTAPLQIPLQASQAGVVQGIDPLVIGRATLRLGAGRSKKGDDIDHRVGIVLEKKVGDQVIPGEVWAVVHASNPERAQEVEAMVQGALHVSDLARPPQLILDRIAR